MNRPFALSLIALALLSACATPPTGLTTTQAPANTWRYSVPEQPEAASGNNAKPGWAYARQAVAAANPLATDAG
ncbi:MAG: gamma-glutamyltransferase, partial [Limnohabitans sp.]